MQWQLSDLTNDLCLSAKQLRKGTNSHKTLHVTEIRVRVRLTVTLNGIVKVCPMLNSGSGGAVHSAVSHVLK